MRCTCFHRAADHSDGRCEVSDCRCGSLKALTHEDEEAEYQRISALRGKRKAYIEGELGWGASPMPPPTYIYVRRGGELRREELDA